MTTFKKTTCKICLSTYLPVDYIDGRTANICSKQCMQLQTCELNVDEYNNPYPQQENFSMHFYAYPENIQFSDFPKPSFNPSFADEFIRENTSHSSFKSMSLFKETMYQLLLKATQKPTKYYPVPSFQKFIKEQERTFSDVTYN